MKLVVNADDFGLTPGINQGILDCFLANSISSATLMVTTSATDEAVDIAKSNTALGIGLHFNLTLGRPLNKPETISSLVREDGSFHSRVDFEKRMILGRIRHADVIREFYSQVRRFETLGIVMTHVDSHQHVHLFPAVFNILAEYCERENIPLRVPWVWPQSWNVSCKRSLRAIFLKLLIHRNIIRWQNRLKYNAGFASIFDLSIPPNRITIDNYLSIISNIKKGPFELMVHPSRSDQSLVGLTNISEISLTERRILSTYNLKELAQPYGIELVSYKKALE